MLSVWISVSVSYYITNFILKYLKGDIFVNSAISALSEVLSLFMAGYFYLKFGLIAALTVSFGLGFVGGMLIMFFESVPSLMPIFVLLTRFGIGSAFGLIYLANFIFPVTYASQTLGFCNTTARTFTIMSPIIAEQEFPAPMIVFCALCIYGISIIRVLEIKKIQPKE